MYKIWKFCHKGMDSSRKTIPLLFLLIFVFLSTAGISQELSAEDAALTVRIRETILDDSRLPIDGISIFVINGAIRLKGVVETLAQKRWINELIYGLPKVRVVDNRLSVLAPNVNDDALSQIVKSQLLNAQNELLDYSHVDVDTEDGNISLKGEVNSLGAKFHAEDITAVTKGVRSMKNKLRVRDTQNNQDVKIEKAVRDALRERISMNRNYKVEVSVIHGTVTLKGRLSAERDRAISIRTALFTPGVAEIIDKIEVLPR
ncbi:MAG: BON domain-containing protein [bacterium]